MKIIKAGELHILQMVLIENEGWTVIEINSKSVIFKSEYDGKEITLPRDQEFTIGNQEKKPAIQ